MVLGGHWVLVLTWTEFVNWTLDRAQQIKQAMTAGHLCFCGDPIVTNFMLYLFCGDLINCYTESF